MLVWIRIDNPLVNEYDLIDEDEKGGELFGPGNPNNWADKRSPFGYFYCGF